MNLKLKRVWFLIWINLDLWKVYNNVNGNVDDNVNDDR